MRLCYFLVKQLLILMMELNTYSNVLVLFGEAYDFLVPSPSSSSSLLTIHKSSIQHSLFSVMVLIIRSS